MAADKWLEEELAELDEAELIIQQAMSGFPSVNNESEAKGDHASTGANNRQVTTTTIPKAESDLDKLTSQLIGGFDSGKKSNGDFNLPPPPDLDDLVISKKENSSAKQSDLPPPPSSLFSSNSQPPKDKKAMSKSPPPPVLPKPSRSTSLKAKTTSKEKSQKASGNVPPLDAGEAPKLPPPASSIPKNIEKNSVDELDFLTNNLLSNMEHYKDEDFYGYCEKCNSVVEGEKVGCNALGGVYHIKCFTCVTCGKELHGVPFFAVEKTTYCESCYTASLEKCTVCSENITDRVLRATGKAYHPKCFKCSDCGKSLDGIPFAVDDDGFIYAVDCYHQKYAPRCCVCKLPILPEPGKEESVRVVAMDRSYHVTCYKCEKCDVQFSTDMGCYPIDNHIYCQPCNGMILQERAAA